MDALLLDYNGVIVDDEPVHFLALKDVLVDRGIGLTEAAYYEDFVGTDDRAAFRKAFARAGRDLAPDALGELVARKAARYAELAGGNLALVPGVGAFVRAAEGRARIAVASGALRHEIEQGLALAGIRDLVGAIVSQEDTHTTKPDPAGFRLALARLADREPGETWRALAVEDSPPGLLAARALGAGCLMLTTSYPAGALAGADLTWDTFEGHAPAELEPLWRPVEVRP
ncbi:MAG: HAD family hydrolase [Gemmatimonadales bacterium]